MDCYIHRSWIVLSFPSNYFVSKRCCIVNVLVYDMQLLLKWIKRLDLTVNKFKQLVTVTLISY